MPFFARPARGGLLATAARTAVVAGTAQVVTGRIAARQRARAAQAAAAAPAATPVAPAALGTPAPAGDPTTEALRQLAQLHEQGVLSYAEFTAAKQRLLGLPETPAS